jgi:hypothetical protein
MPKNQHNVASTSASATNPSGTEHPIVTRMRNDDSIHYAATPNLVSLAEYYSTGRQGNRLVMKNDELVPTEARNFFITLFQH